MRLKSYNILFRIFSFLSDKTNGAPFFVKYKLLLGTLIIGMALPIKAQEKVNERDTISYQQVSNKKNRKPIVTPPKSNTLDKIEINLIGNVKDDEFDEPLIGVTVLIKNSTTGTVTDVDGIFDFIAKVNEDDILEFSLVGYETKEVLVSEIKDGKVSITLKSDVTILCYEVITIHHRGPKKAKVTNTNTKIKKITKK